VLWVIKGRGPGGAEHLLVSYARRLDREAFDVSVAYVLDWKTALVEPLRAEGVAVHCLGVKRATDPRWLVNLRRLLVEQPVDVIHVHSPLVAAGARAVRRSLRRPPAMVSTEHNSWASHDRWTRLLNRVTYGLDDAHIAVSPQVVGSLPPALRDRTEVVVQGLDVEAAQALATDRDGIRAELGIPPDRVIVCTVANLRWQKGYPDLMAAARRVIDGGHDVVFLAVGQGPLEAALRERHAELGLGDRFRFLGYRQDAARLLAGADVFALASLHEGYPIAVMEAMTCGLPIVATDAGGIPDAVTDGVEGFVVPARRPDALADALSQVLADAPLRRKMSDAARARGRLFDIGAAVDRTQGIYREVAERRCRP
jgi:glycosyltransferase involved in cell wall biosynthesis